MDEDYLISTEIVDPTDERDPFFLFTLTIGEQDFQPKPHYSSPPLPLNFLSSFSSLCPSSTSSGSNPSKVYWWISLLFLRSSLTLSIPA